MRSIFPRILSSLIGAVGVALVGLFLLSPYFGQGIIHLSYDLPFSIRPYPTKAELNHLVIVSIDDDSAEILHQPNGGIWNRAQTHARLLERLKQEHARAAVFDVVFDNPHTRTEDDRFAQTIRDFGHVVLAADASPIDYGSSQVRNEQITPPIDSFLEGAAGIGTVNLQPDSDMVVRRIPSYDPQDQLVAPLCWAALEVVTGTSSGTNAPDTRERWINYYMPVLPSVSYVDALSTNKVCPPGFFHNKIVYIGAQTKTKTYGERKDEYGTVYTRWQAFSHAQEEQSLFTAGVNIQATMFLNLLRGDWMNRLSLNQELYLCLFIALFFGAGLVQLKPVAAAGTAFAAMALVAGTDYLLFVKANTWFAWLVTESEIGVALLWSIFYNSVSLYVQKRLMQQSLSMYVSPSQVKRIIKNPTLLHPGAEKQEVSILFSDIAGFTSLSEGMDSDELAALMNGYFESAVAGAIYPTEGTVIKFIGDAIFAIWNAPEPQTDHAVRACRSALLLRDQVTNFPGKKPGQTIQTRIGLHTGVANVGNFGSSRRIDYTALGENINLASRMEGLNKYLGTRVLITGDAHRAAQGYFRTRYLGLFQLKGFAKAVEVFELLGEIDGNSASLPWLDPFSDALEAFSAGEFEPAADLFQQILDFRSDDGPSRFYLGQIESLRAQPPGPGWRGEIELKEK